MNRKNLIALLLCVLVATTGLFTAILKAADPPGLLSHQGRIAVDGVNFSGSGQFKFSLVKDVGVGTEVFLWHHDGTTLGADEPDTALTVPVSGGHYAVLLGEANAITSEVFADNDHVSLRIWFSADDGATFEQLAPDRRIASVGYALSAGNLASNGFRIESPGGVPNLIGGFGENTIDMGREGSVIAGGGDSSGDFNYIEANFAAISGGAANRVEQDADFAAIQGGRWNRIREAAVFSSIGGGGGNTIEADASHGTIAGGSANHIYDFAYVATIGGGENNVILQETIHATIGGGVANLIRPRAEKATIGGGEANEIYDDAEHATISGGKNNLIQDDTFNATIAGGRDNTIETRAVNASIGGGEGNFIDRDTDGATIAGGLSNRIDPFVQYANIGGGTNNLIRTETHNSTIGGGRDNEVEGGAENATIPGGRENVVGADYAFAAGFRASAQHLGSFVWSDSNPTPISSSAINQFTVRAGGGVRFFSNVENSLGVHLPVNGTSWGTLSDRNVKKNFEPVDTGDVLEKLAGIPIQQWNYKAESDDDVPHIGPMAQDFKSAFFPGRDETRISTLEFDGVALAAIQGLKQLTDAQAREIDQQKAENEKLKERLTRLEERERRRDAEFAAMKDLLLPGSRADEQ